MTNLEWTIRFVGYYPIDDRVDARLRRVCEEIDKVPASALHVDEEAQVVTIDYSQVRDWFDASRQFVHTTRVGTRIVIKPPWEGYQATADDIVLEIDPGAVFGSGLHETTQVVLRALEEHLKPADSVVDFGTGSGVLAIAAAKLGASRVIAFDINPASVEVAKANVVGNAVEDVVEVFHADDLSFADCKSDLVVANVTRITILENSKAFAQLSKIGGKLIVSGFGAAQAADVEECLSEECFEVH